MSTSRDAATEHRRGFGIGPADRDLPPAGSEEDTIVGISSSTRSAASENAIKNHVFVKRFESGGTYLSLDMKEAREQLKKEVEKGRGIISNLRKKAQGARAQA